MSTPRSSLPKWLISTSAKVVKAASEILDKTATVLAVVIGLAVAALYVAPLVSSKAADWILKIGHEQLGTEAYYSTGAAVDAALLIAVVLVAGELWKALAYPFQQRWVVPVFIASPVIAIGLLAISTASAVEALLHCNENVCSSDAQVEVFVLVGTEAGLALLVLQGLVVLYVWWKTDSPWAAVQPQGSGDDKEGSGDAPPRQTVPDKEKAQYTSPTDDNKHSGAAILGAGALVVIGLIMRRRRRP